MNPRPPLELFLRRIVARSLLTEADQDAILSLPGKAIEVRANRDFVRLGEHVTNACLVVEGLVGRFGQNKDGARQITSLHIPGDMVDLHSVVVPHAPAALQAVTNTTILQIPHDKILDISHRHPNVMEAFWRDCVVDGAISAQWVLNVGRRNAQARLAHLLCEMAVRYDKIDRARGLTFDFPVNQTHLADCTGLTPVHVNRSLGALKRAELVSMTQKKVEILDWKGLVDIAEFDTAYLAIASPLEAHEESKHEARA